MALNTITVMGRITKDIDLKYTNDEKPVISFSLAVDRDYKNADGSKDCDFIDCVCFGPTAKFISEHFGKGSGILVNGRLQIREWTDKEGNKRRSAEIFVNNTYFVGDSKSAPKGMEERNAAISKENARFNELNNPDSDLPF